MNYDNEERRPEEPDGAQNDLTGSEQSVPLGTSAYGSIGRPRSMAHGDALALAEAYANSGLPVFPVAISWDPEKAATNKRPLTPHGFKDASTDIRQVRRMFNKATLRPGEAFGVGVWPGPAGFVVLDPDVKGGARGDEELQVLERRHGKLPATLWVTTPSCGAHVWFKKGNRRIGNKNLAPGIDVRADDGFVVAPGTWTPWGEWAWDGGLGILDGAPVADVPEWVLDELGVVGTSTGTPQASLSPAGRWSPLDEEKLHPADRAALHALRRLGGHGEYLAPGGCVEVVRPGKRAGGSASIGYFAPGVVKVFTTDWPGLPGGVYDADELDAIVDGGLVGSSSSGGTGTAVSRPRGPKVSKSDLDRQHALDLLDAEFEIGRTSDNRTFLVPVRGPNVALFTRDARSQLSRRLVELGTPVRQSVLDEVWMVIEARAHGVPKSTLPLRVALVGTELILDLGDEQGRAVVVTPSGWTVVERSPVTFERSRAALPLPVPEIGGTWSELFGLLNVAPHHRELFVAWMVAALMPNLPHPILLLRGDQGSAKSASARCLTTVLDPCVAPTQKPPKDEEEWATACKARWVVAVDNISTVREWWSDAMCRTVSGDGWLRRALYTDDDVVVTAYRRCLILNGITIGKVRPDLAERMLTFDLDRPQQFLAEAEVGQRMAAMAPRVLGALLGIAADTLRHLPLTRPPVGLRMADFAHIVAAVDAATGFSALDAFKHQVARAFGDALESDPLAVAILAFMDGRQEWRGAPNRLLSELEYLRPPGDADWPTSARQLTEQLARCRVVLGRAGVTYDRGPRTKHGTPVVLTATLGSVPGTLAGGGVPCPEAE